MSLSQKIALYFVLLGVCIGIGSYAAITYTIFPAFEEFEDNESMEALDRVERAIAAESRTIKTLLTEYAHWNDTYDFALGKYDGYVAENLNADYWSELGVDVVLIFNADGRLLFANEGSNNSALSSVDVDRLLLDQVNPAHPLPNVAKGSGSIVGMVRSSDGPMLVASSQIRTTYGDGPSAGTFIVARRIGSLLVDAVSERTSAVVNFHPVTASGGLDYSLAQLEQMSATGPFRWSYSTRNEVVALELLSDVAGAPVALVEVRQPHMITEIGTDTIQAAMILIGGITVVFMIFGLVVMRFMIVRPVNKIAESMNHIRETGDLNIHVQKQRADEIGALAREFKSMTTNLDQTQRELEATRDIALEASRAKSEFLARMSHEIRTPMNGVLGMTELLRGTVLDFEQRRFTETIYSSAENLLDIINDILDFSKIEAGKMSLESRDINLGSLIEEAVDSLAPQAQKKGIELINDVAPALHESLIGDPVRIRQVITNLVSNAIKFTDRGEVVVRATVVEDGVGTADVYLEVVDTGIGIQPEKQAAIFDSFAQEDGSTTRLHGGTGLGLAICRQLVSLMGGTLEVASTPGIGSRFFFTISMMRGSGETPAKRRTTASVAGKRILIVDDNATNCEILEQHLKSWRARPRSAGDAEEALQLLGLAQADGDPYELAILDMHMPRMDGLQLARKIRNCSEYGDLSLMLLSSVAMPATATDMDELKISGQLTKPVRQGQLYDSLAVVLSGDVLTQRYSHKDRSSTRALFGKVLLAEDNPVNQAVALGMLEMLGVDVAVVTDGQAAIDAINSQTFDLVLMDCQMPVMDGLEATRKIRAAETEQGRCHLPIIALTANALTGDRERCLEAGMNEYLSKPFTIDQLHAVLSMFMRSDNMPDSADGPEEVLSAEAASLFDTQSITIQPLDHSALGVLRDLQQAGTPSLISKVIGIYLDSSAKLKEQLLGAIKNDDPDAVREAAHALKSSSINVGATRLADLCNNIENMARQKSLGAIRDMQQVLNQEYVRATSALQIELECATK